MISRLIGWINATEQDQQLWDSSSPPWAESHRQALETQRMLEAMETSMTTGQTVTL
jgi:hypothetical protein